MKRLLSLMILCATLISAVAQSPHFFGGLKLGMSSGEVRTILSNKNQSFETDNYKGDTRYIVKNPTLGGVTFQTLVLRFSGNRLVVADFDSNDSAGGYPGAPRFSQVSSIARSYRSNFNTLYASLKSKYGQPSASDEYEYSWIYNGNIIKLCYIFTDEMVSEHMRESYTQIYLMYESPNSSDL